MKNIFLFILICHIVQSAEAQQNYCDFEGLKVLSFGPATGILDSMFANPDPNNIDSSANCGKYIRSTIAYDNFKLYPSLKLSDVSSYESNDPMAPKFTMKVYSTAPPGTFIHVQLGAKNDDVYPSGIHSEYRGMTTVQNAWQNLIFNYLQSPAGSLVLPTEVDKIVLLLAPASSVIETMYFDDLTGPFLIPSGVDGNDNIATFKLSQNSPNPVQILTHIDFQLSTPGKVSLKLFDMLGNPLLSILDKTMKAGIYSIPVGMENIPNGIYFYVLKKEQVSRTMKLIVSK